MDCMRACEAVSAANDGELVDSAQLAEARAHAATCPQCRAFERLLPRLDSVPAPRAPGQLVDRLVAMSADAAAEARDAAAKIAAAASEPEQKAPEKSGPTRWVPRFAAFAAAAAILLVAFVVGSVILLNSGHKAEIAGEVALSSDDGSRGAPQATAPTEGTGTTGNTGTLKSSAAPAYVAFDGGVWVLADLTPPASSSLTTAGVVTSSLGQDGNVTERTTYFAGADHSVLWVNAPDGRQLAFERVIRTLGGAEYGLSSDSDIRDFGTWPMLPSRFPQPEGSDGSPTFVHFGFDDLNRDVYVPAAGRIDDGFAIAPGTPSTDPAAGNPGWTWWDRLR